MRWFVLLVGCGLLAGCSVALGPLEACGNGVVENGEYCDGDNLDGETCISLGYMGGTLRCASNCQYNTSDCAMKNCGNGVVEDDEGCDDGNRVSGEGCSAICAVEVGWSCTVASPSVCSENITSPNIGVLISVPAGTFQRDATPTNLSVVSAFRMSQYEITRAQWVAVTGWADPSDLTISSGTNDPVQMVNWYHAIAFCNKLSQLEGLTPVYAVSSVDFSTLAYAQIPTTDNATWNAATANWAANGYRLPTEMEWMWAAMGADTADPGEVNTTGYSNAFAGSTGSNAIGNYSWYDVNSVNKTHPVGTKLPNELGFYDMSGNVHEWCWDWFESTYPAGQLTDVRGPASGNGRVLRGGSYYYNASYCTVAYRLNSNPEFDSYDFGFRVVRP